MGVPSGYTSAQVVQAVPTGINSALVLIKSQTIGSAVSSVAITDIFSTTYENYRVTISGGAGSAEGSGNFILGSTTTGYYSAYLVNASSSSTPGGVATSNGANSGVCFGFNTGGINVVIDLFSPFETKKTAYHFRAAIPGVPMTQWHGGGLLDNTTSYTAMTFTTGSGTLTGGTIKVYGYANS